MKKCSRCKLQKDSKDFQFLNKKENTLRPECRLCRKLYVPTPKPKLIPLDSNNKVCHKCFKEKARSEYNQMHNQKGYKYLRPNCILCEKESHNKWSKKQRITNPEFRLRKLLSTRINSKLKSFDAETHQS